MPATDLVGSGRRDRTTGTPGEQMPKHCRGCELPTGPPPVEQNLTDSRPHVNRATARKVGQAKQSQSPLAGVPAGVGRKPALVGPVKPWAGSFPAGWVSDCDGNGRAAGFCLLRVANTVSASISPPRRLPDGAGGHGPTGAPTPTLPAAARAQAGFVGVGNLRRDGWSEGVCAPDGCYGVSIFA